MKTSSVPFIIHIPATCDTFDLKRHAQNVTHIQIIIESNANVTLYDSDTSTIEHIEVILGSGAHLFWVSDCPHENLLITCMAHSRIYYAQVIGKAIAATRQHLAIKMQEENAQSSVRIFPFLNDAQHCEYNTIQQHDAASTVSDLQIVGHVGGNAQFGHNSMITVKPSLTAIRIVQKTIMFLSGPHINAYARPSFDIASKDVHCTHGAALGALDDNQLWYLQSRGLNNHSAMQLIIQSRCLATISKEIPQHVLEYICSRIVANQ